MGSNERRIAIVNTYGDDNRGSAALNIAAVHLVREAFPDAVVGLVPINEFDESERAHRYRHTIERFPDIEVLAPIVRQETLRSGAISSIPAELLARRLPLRLLDRRTDEFLRSSDVVVSRGGVIYRDCSTMGNLAAFLRRTAALRLAQAESVPTVLLGLHAGRPNSPIGARLMRRQYRRADLVLPRGPLSAEVVREIAAAPITRLPDSVIGGPFLLPAAERSATGHLVLAVSDPARPLFGDIATLVGRLADAGRVERVTVVAHSLGLDSDVGASETISRQLPVPTTLVTDDLSPSQLVELYATADLVLASRLHAAILGLLARTPSHPIELSQDRKAIDTFTEIGLGHMVLDPSRPAEWEGQLAGRPGASQEDVSDATEAAAGRYGVLADMLRDVSGHRAGPRRP